MKLWLFQMILVKDSYSMKLQLGHKSKEIIANYYVKETWLEFHKNNFTMNTWFL